MIGGGNYIEYQNLMDYCKVRMRILLITLNRYPHSSCELT